MEGKQRGVSGTEQTTAEILAILKEKIEYLKEKDLELLQRENILDKERKALRPKIEELGRMLEAVGLPTFSTGDYTLNQSIRTKYIIKDEKDAKRKLIKLFDEQGLYDQYVKIDDRSLSKQVRLLIERGVEVPWVTEDETWICNITKG